MPDYIQSFKAAVPKVIAKAWTDPAFESLLISNPTEAFKSFDISLPSNFDLRVVKHDKADSSQWTLTESNGRSLMTLPLPPAPGGSADSGVSAAAGCSSSSICCTG